MVDLETRVEMYLRPVATGVYDWIPIDRTNDMIVLREHDIVITDGNQNLNSDTGVPNRCAFSVRDPNGHLNRKNPLGDYWGSIGLGTQTRIGVLRVDDQFGRTIADTNWGSVGNTDGDTWTAGTSSGGTVAAGDWSVASGSARHSLPVADCYRLSELSKNSRLLTNVEVRRRFKVPTSNVTGTGAIATETWLRTIDISNFLAVSYAFLPDESVQIAIYDRTAGVNRYLLYYTTISGLSLSSTVDYELRCHVEGGTVRAKIWEVGDPEPLDWQAIGSDAVVREGYMAIADYVYAGNTNTKPLVCQHDFIQASIPVFFGEITDLTPSGEDKSETKVTEVEAAGILDRLQSSKAPPTSVMRRTRAGKRAWLRLGNLAADSGTVRSITLPTSELLGVTTGDFFFLNDVDSTNTSQHKEDAKFVVTGSSVAGANTTLTFTPDARVAIALDDTISCYRESPSTVQPIAYWPMEDGESATQILSGLVNGDPMSVVDSPDFGAESGFQCSFPVLKINDAELTGTIPDYTDPGVFTVTFLLSMPDSDEAATGTDLFQFYTTGTGYSWDLRYTANGGGSFQLLVFNAGLTLLFDSGQIDFSMRGDRGLITLVCKQVGGTVTYQLFKVQTDTGAIGGVGPATVTGVTTLGKITQVRVNPGGGYDDVGYGHLTVVPAEWGSSQVGREARAWLNQAAMFRYMRLCYEENIPFTYRASVDVLTPLLGHQKVEKIGQLFKRPAESDGGFLIGSTGALALEYISRGALLNLGPVATFSVSSGHVKPPFNPKADYSAIENLVTVNRIDGSTAVSELTDGDMSTQNPPDGVRIRPGDYDLSLGGDYQAQYHADWRQSVGTLDQYRIPRLELTPAGNSAVSVERMLSIGVGMRVDITDLSSKDIYDDLQQLVNGRTLRLGMREYPRISLVCSPYEVYRTFALTSDDRARPGMVDTETASTLTSSQTGSLTIISSTGYYLVTTDAADFPMNVMIDGEVMTWSAVVDTATPGQQTATISVRGVNGAAKAHASGVSVQLAEPNRYQFKS